MIVVFLSLYTTQVFTVKRDNSFSLSFKTANGIQQGGIPLAKLSIAILLYCFTRYLVASLEFSTFFPKFLVLILRLF